MGVVGMCRKWLNIRCELQSLITECESTIGVMRVEFGNFEVNTTFESLLNQVERAKRIAKSCDTCGQPSCGKCGKVYDKNGVWCKDCYSKVKG